MAEVSNTVKIPGFYKVYWKIYARFLLETEEYKYFDERYPGRTAKIDQAALFMSWIPMKDDHILVDPVAHADKISSEEYGIIFRGINGRDRIKSLYAMMPYGHSYNRPEDIYWEIIDKDKAMLTKMMYG